ncbi:hypothetical protein MAFF241648_21310 [Ralstonia solanacearum]|nr:hypothetical protein MAFF241648_21310 [Ralstonia solanacearum]
MEAKVGLEFIANMDYEAITITSLKEIAQHRPNDTKAFHLPTDDVICIKCPRSLWRTEKRQLDGEQSPATICYCRVMHATTWSTDNPIVIDKCDEPALAAIEAQEALARAEEKQTKQ